eukprot:gene1686-1787_t
MESIDALSSSPNQHQYQYQYQYPYESNFPERLYSILTYERLDSITWMEDGSGFRITDPRAFESSVINKYFPQRKIRSFFRQLNTYGFVRASGTGWRNKYSFSHPLFQRGLPHLLRGMQRRNPSCRNRTSSPM